MKDVVNFLHEVKLELSKVVWPKWEEFWGSTIIVLVLVVISSVFLGFVDFLFRGLVELILKFFSA